YGRPGRRFQQRVRRRGDGLPTGGGFRHALRAWQAASRWSIDPRLARFMTEVERLPSPCSLSGPSFAAARNDDRRDLGARRRDRQVEDALLLDPRPGEAVENEAA